MKRHWTDWPGIGLLCAALSSAAVGQNSSTPEVVAEQPSLTTGTSSFAIQARERLKDPEQRKALRAVNRQSVEQEYAQLDQVLPLEADTRSKLLELLTDLRMESIARSLDEPRSTQIGPYPSPEALQAAVERERFGDNDLQRSASQATRDRQRVRELLGETRFQQFIDDESTLFQRQQVAYFNDQLPAGDRLDTAQRERLILLLNEQRQQEDEAQQLKNTRINGEHARRGYRDIASRDDRSLEDLRIYEERLQQVEADSKQLLAKLAGLLTPRQLTRYEANEAKRVSQELQIVKRMRKRAGVDVEKPPVLPPDPNVMIMPRTALAGRVRLDVSIKVNDSAVTQRSVFTDNGGMLTFEIAPLTIEAKPILFEDGWRELTLKFYEPDGKGGRRRIIPNTVGAGIMADAEPVQTLDALALGSSRGYAIIGNLKLSAAGQ